MRQLVTIREVASITPIPGADNIETAHIDGWTVVVRKGEFTPQALCVFFEIDSFIPSTDQRFAFLAKQERVWRDKKGYRLKTIKLKKQLSQGLALPVGLFPELAGLLPEAIATTLGVELWEDDHVHHLAGNAKGLFPEFIRKTDQERAQNCWKDLPQDLEWERTTKMDGTSLTVFLKESVLGVCSRNLELKLDETNQDNLYVSTAHKSGLLEYLPRLREALGYDLAIQGEICGPSIQSNRAKLAANEVHVFDIWNITEQRYLLAEERFHVIDLLTAWGCLTRPVPLYHAYCWGSGQLPKTFEELLKSSEGPVNPGNPEPREGLVYKCTSGPHSFKVISNEYLIKHGL